MLKRLFVMAAAASATLATAQTAPDPAAVAQAAPPAVMLSTDRREAVVQLCIAEAKTRLAKQGVTDVTLKEVQDTDLFEDGRASTRLKVQVTKTNSKGQTDKDNATVGCKTLSGVVNEFKYDD